MKSEINVNGRAAVFHRSLRVWAYADAPFRRTFPRVVSDCLYSSSIQSLLEGIQIDCLNGIGYACSIFDFIH